MPGHKFIQTSDFVVGDNREDICRPALWIDTIQLGSFDQRVRNGR
jgi:hypothetical protein